MQHRATLLLSELHLHTPLPPNFDKGVQSTECVLLVTQVQRTMTSSLHTHLKFVALAAYVSPQPLHPLPAPPPCQSPRCGRCQTRQRCCAQFPGQAGHASPPGCRNAHCCAAPAPAGTVNGAAERGVHGIDAGAAG
jgi:hypothetical protein